MDGMGSQGLSNNRPGDYQSKRSSPEAFRPGYWPNYFGDVFFRLANTLTMQDR